MNFETLYVIIDDFLKISEHKEDKQVQMNDSEIIFAYLISFQYFSGNYFKTLYFLKQTGILSNVLCYQSWRLYFKISWVHIMLQFFYDCFIGSNFGLVFYCKDLFQW